MRKRKSFFKNHGMELGAAVFTLIIVLGIATEGIAVIPSIEPNLPVVEITEANSITFRSVFTSESVSKAELEAFEKASKLGENDTLYLILDTPGGSVEAGFNLIDSLKALRPKVKTITLFAASMGFHTVQGLGERIITPSGILMSHRMAIQGLSGQVPGEANTRLAALTKDSDNADMNIARRLGITTKRYQKMIHDEMWLTGHDAVSLRAADSVALIKCEESMIGKIKNESIRTFFGTVVVSFSSCPLIRAPLSISFSGLSVEPGTKEYKEVKELVEQMIEDKTDFVQNYIVNNRFTKFIKE